MSGALITEKTEKTEKMKGKDFLLKIAHKHNRDAMHVVSTFLCIPSFLF